MSLMSAVATPQARNTLGIRTPHIENGVVNFGQMTDADRLLVEGVYAQFLRERGWRIVKLKECGASRCLYHPAGICFNPLDCEHVETFSVAEELT